MALWLDHLTFGNGHGMSSPYFDAKYCWLVDTAHGERDGRHGQLYRFSHGLGAQLHSWQWTHPRPGERRRLVGREFVAYQSNRRWLRVEVSWRMVRLPDDLSKANAAIHELERDIGR